MILLHAFSGFLGSREDWEFLRPAIESVGEMVTHEVDPLPGESWDAWTRRWLSEHPVPTESRDREVLLGYSLGGRAAFHLACSSDARFKGLLALSSHPGLKSDSDRLKRAEDDELWARRFAEDPWTTVLAAWDRQAIFGSAPASPATGARRLRDQTRLRSLAQRQLQQLSLGKQCDLRGQLDLGKVPQFWCVGEFDSKYKLLLEGELSRPGTRLRGRVVPRSHHRWPWELPPEVSRELIMNALKELIL